MPWTALTVIAAVLLTPTAPATPPTDTAPEPGSAAGLWLLLIAFAAIWIIGWRISLRLHPFKACPRCSGSGKHHGTWFKHSFRACDRCGGVGREYRTFARAPYKQNENKRRGRR
ncbi:hypothetical protein ACFVH6_30395 [Spirillospora sp. NPDC127200]